MTRWIPVFVALAGAAVASEPQQEAHPYEGTWPAIFERFNHRQHDRVLDKQGIPCTGCHQVGGRLDTDALAAEKIDETFLTPPRGACHFCHNPPEDKPQIGPGACSSCHADLQPPPSHGAGWLSYHGSEARADRQACADCHNATRCVDCHERKEGVRFTVHDRTWIAVHGLSAMAQPASCSSCHLQADCVACHATADGRRP